MWMTLYHLYQKALLHIHLYRTRIESAARISSFAFGALLAFSLIVPTIANADILAEIMQKDETTTALIVASMQNKTQPYGKLPDSEETLPRRTYSIVLTAYNADPAQTDDTPCITTSGLNLCERNEEDIVAANFLPMGTRVRIPELFGDRVFYVEDRMNARYRNRMDIWMKEKAEAKQFGVQRATIEVF